MSYQFVIKRNGQKVEFNKDKIVEAIAKAGKATEEFDYTKAELITKIVMSKIDLYSSTKETYTDSISLECIQDIVESTLMNTQYKKTGKAYMLYRDQRTKAREITTKLNNGLIDKYINVEDWKVKENSNTTFSLQGMNNYLVNELSSEYWLNVIYPPEIRNAHKSGDFHIHDLGLLASYCCGWSLEDLLLKGFTGVPGKIASKPPKHFRTALGQLVNFLYSLQSETSGAQAVSNFDTLLAPFIRYDGLDYLKVKQAMQEFIFNCNVPTRVGFQCVPEWYECLTPKGWATYDQLNVGDEIYVKDLNTGEIKLDTLLNVKVDKYTGDMIKFFNRKFSFAVTPEHRVVRKSFNSMATYGKENLVIDSASKLHNFKSTVEIPLAGFITAKRKGVNLTMDEIELLAWTLSDCHIDAKSSRLRIYQSPKKYAHEVAALLKRLNCDWYAAPAGGGGFGDIVHRFDVKGPLAKKMIEYTEGYREHVPRDFINNATIEQIDTFITTYIKADGYVRPIGQSHIFKKNEYMADCLQELLILSNHGSRRLYRNNVTDAIAIYKYPYASMLTETMPVEDLTVWCPTTLTGTFICRNEFKVPFITGNCPFLNITMDLKVPNMFKDTPVIIGGKYQETTYGDYQPEVDMINRAFCEVMTEGDASGRIFSFPIPTYSITKDFDWDNPNHDYLFEMTGKLGVPYFSNFVNSDMSPEDSRSMCCRLRLDNRELRKRGGGLFGASPLTGCYDDQTEVLTVDGWKWWKDLTLEDDVMTLTKDNIIEIHKPTKLFQYDWDGELIRFKAKSLDLLVTPNHRMVADHRFTKERIFPRADEFSGNTHWIPKKGLWLGEDIRLFTLPALDEKYPEIKIPMELWLAFFGIYLAEGSFSIRKDERRTNYQVHISQTKPDSREKIRELLTLLPFKFSEVKGGFEIYHKQLTIYLSKFGHQDKRYIPRWMFGLSSKYLSVLAQWLILGDGWIRKEGIQLCYWTTSKQLANNMQELFLRLNCLSTCIEQHRLEPTFIKGHPILSTKPCYCIGLQTTNYYRLRDRNITKEYYKGKVYCCTVENNTVMVRRNGRMTWCGNSIGVVTINLPRLGYISKTEEEFINKLNELLHLAKESLVLKRKMLNSFTEKGLYPYTSFYLSAVHERFGSVWQNHFSTIGIIGMNEAVKNLFGTDLGDPEAIKFSNRVLDHIRDSMIEFQEETGCLFNLEATPAEGTSYSLALKDKKKYPEILSADYNSDTPMYTNSTHLPVNFTDDIFELLDLQDEMQTKYTGGTVIHLFIGERIREPHIVKNLVRRVCENYHLPYFSISPTFSTCNDHGYISGEEYSCPICGRETEIFSRIVGYYRPTRSWNEGKQAEFVMRKTFKIKD